MTRPIYGSRLLKTASHLAGAGAGRGRPALSDLRRATSTAYYAVFHQVVRHSAYDFLPNGSEDDIAEIARWYTHTGVLHGAGLVVTAASSKPLRHIGKGDRAAAMALRVAGSGACGRRPAHRGGCVSSTAGSATQRALRRHLRPRTCGHAQPRAGCRGGAQGLPSALASGDIPEGEPTVRPCWVSHLSSAMPAEVGWTEGQVSRG